MSEQAIQASNASRAFWLACRRCEEERPLPGNKIEMLAAPSIVCAAFAIELGLKAMILSTGASISGHDLEKLFGRLDRKQQLDVIKKMQRSEADFLAELKAIAHAFVDWRYVYEKQSLAIESGFLRDLAKAVQT